MLSVSLELCDRGNTYMVSIVLNNTSGFYHIQTLERQLGVMVWKSSIESTMESNAGHQRAALAFIITLNRQQVCYISLFTHSISQVFG